MADLTSGLWIAIAALTGLAGRSASARGCYVDVSMMDIQVSLLTIAAARYFALGESPGREGTEHPGRVPSAAFECADGQWMQVSASDQHWIDLCSVLSLHDLARDETLRTNAGRVRRRTEISPRLKAGFLTKPRAQILEELERLKVPAGAINTVEQILADPHTVARGMIGTFDYPGVGSFPALRNPLLLEGFDNPEFVAPPVLGQHSNQVLRELLGYDEAQIARLNGAVKEGTP